ncbi:MAG: hypothetical protein R3C26_18855 [Calditrichia bacterium]
MKRLFFTIIIAVLGTLRAQTWQSEIVYFGNGGKLVYVADSLGNRIPVSVTRDTKTASRCQMCRP